MKIIEKKYKIIKDGKETGREVAFICKADANRVNDAYRRLKLDYPEEKGFWLIHIEDIFSVIGEA